MKRILTVLTVLAAAMMLNGCTKCSQEQPAEPPPIVEPPAGETTEGEAMPGDMTGAPTEMAPDTTSAPAE